MLADAVVTTDLGNFERYFYLGGPFQTLFVVILGWEFVFAIRKSKNVRVLLQKSIIIEKVRENDISRRKLDTLMNQIWTIL